MPAPQDIHSCSYMCARMECVKAQRDELRERMAELERDAARYRWLRDGDIAPGICVFAGTEIVLCDEALDAAIDAAMKA